MGTTLEHGVYLPDEGERNCYAGLKVNWEILNQKVADIVALQSAIAGALHREIVASLPTTDIDPNTIYMILSGTSATENVYDEYMYVNNAWELIGTSATDLTNYYTKAEVDGKLLLKASVSDLTSHTGDTTIHVTASDKTKWTNSANTHVLRLALSALTPSTSGNSFSNLDDSTALKVGDKVMDTAGVLFEVTAIDTQNSTFTIGTALIDLAQDSDVVHKSGNETVAGVKTFSDNSIIKKIISNVAQLQINARSSGDSVAIIAGANATEGGGIWIYGKDNVNNSHVALQVYDTTNSTFHAVRLNMDGALTPTVSNNGLGSKSFKWVGFNGLNPGALSLPDLNNGIDISGYVDVTQTSQYTAPADGYISICGYATSTNAILIKDHDYDFAMTFRALTTSLGATTYFVMPVIKNHVYDISCSAVTTIDYAKFFPCLGNV